MCINKLQINWLATLEPRFFLFVEQINIIWIPNIGVGLYLGELYIPDEDCSFKYTRDIRKRSYILYNFHHIYIKNE